MPEIDGMTLASMFQKRQIETNVVFTTAYDEYAVEAFEANAIDYLLKPLSVIRLEKNCKKIQARLKTSPSQDYDRLLSELTRYSSVNNKPKLKWIKAVKQEEVHLIPINEVSYFKAEDKYVSVFQSTHLGTHEEYQGIRMSGYDLAIDAIPAANTFSKKVGFIMQRFCFIGTLIFVGSALSIFSDMCLSPAKFSAAFSR